VRERRHDRRVPHRDQHAPGLREQLHRHRTHERDDVPNGASRLRGRLHGQLTRPTNGPGGAARHRPAEEDVMNDHEIPRSNDDAKPAALSRRVLLQLMGAVGTASLVSAGSRAFAACTTTPSETEGPYWIDELLNRSDIRTDPSDGTVKSGVLL